MKTVKKELTTEPAPIPREAFDKLIEAFDVAIKACDSAPETLGNLRLGTRLIEMETEVMKIEARLYPPEPLEKWFWRSWRAGWAKPDRTAETTHPAIH